MERYKMSDIKSLMLDLSTNVFLVTDKNFVVLEYNDKAKSLLGNKLRRGRNLSKTSATYIYKILTAHTSVTKEKGKGVSFFIDVKNFIYECFVYTYDFGYVFVFEDITELSDSSKIIKEIMKKVDNAQDLSEIGYYEVCFETRYFFFSHEVYKILGIEERNNRNRDVILENIYPKDLDKFKEKVLKLLENKKKTEMYFRFVKADTGAIINCCIKAEVICDGVCKFVGTFQDLTKVIQSNKELKAAKSKAESLSKSRAYFIGQASHDLRQPIQAMRMNLYSLMKEKMGEKQTRLTSSINDSVENLSYLLDNLIDVSKLGYVGEKYKSSTFNIKLLVSRISEEFKKIARSKKIKFVVKSENKTIDSNSFFIERIIRNLLSNAFKYTKNEVKLELKIRDDKLFISVSDNGHGIKKSELKNIFDEFYKSGSNPDNHDGIGLGLSIVSKMLKLLHGKADVRSKINKGSEFIIEVPIEKEPD